MRVNSSILVLSLALTCSFSFIALLCSCKSGVGNWSGCNSFRGGLGDAGSWCDADSGINDGRESSCSVLLYVWSCEALSTDGTRIVVNAQA